MKFTMEETERGTFVLNVPPANRPLIDGKTGRVVEFNHLDVITGGSWEINRIINALEKLSCVK